MDRVCGEAGCERASCMPEPYRPECARHYMASIKRAQDEAAARFEAHIARLQLRRAFLRSESSPSARVGA